MLLFNTILRVKESFTKDEFVKLVIHWNQSSPFAENVLPGLVWKGDYTFKEETEDLSLEFIEYRNKNTIAARYIKKNEDGIVWTTDYVLNLDKREISVILDRSYKKGAEIAYQKFSTPFFVKFLIEQDFLENDGEFKICYTPYIVDKENYKWISKAIEESSNRLPIVILSRDKGRCVCNPMNLAKKLKGVAHIIVEGGGRIPSLVNMDGKNEAAAIILHSTNQGTRRVENVSRLNIEDENFYFELLVSSLIMRANNQEIPYYLTWEGVCIDLAKDRIKAKTLEVSKSQEEIEEYIEEFDKEFNEFKKREELLRQENNRLSSENAQLKADLKNNDTSKMNFGEAKEIFIGEKNEYVLEAIEESIKNGITGTRKRDILEDIQNANVGKSELKRRREELKNILNSCTGLNKKAKLKLKDIDITVDEDGKHYKLVYGNNPKYMCTMAKTPSEGRGTKNLISEIRKMFF